MRAGSTVWRVTYDTSHLSHALHSVVDVCADRDGYILSSCVVSERNDLVRVAQRVLDSVWKGWNYRTQQMRGVRFAKHRALVAHYVSMHGWALHIAS